MTTTTSGTTTTNTTTATSPTATTSPTTTTSTSEATRATVQKFLELRLAGDTAGLTALFAAEVDW
ncbi:hypothetical protein ABZZ16_42655, partial [Streptomyces sp. NPDC006386]